MPADEKNVAAGPRFFGRSDLAGLDRLGQGLFLGTGASRAENAGDLHRRRHSHRRRRRSGRLAANACADCTKARRRRSTRLRSAAVSSRCVVKTIASLGGGSLRQITGEHCSASWRRPICSRKWPGRRLKNLKIEFQGLRTARVYPEELPNCPAGSQQIVLGRYLPEGGDQKGEVIVSGTLGGKRCVTAASVAQRRRAGQFVHPAALGADAPRRLACSKAHRRRSRTRSSHCRKNITSSRPTRRCWCWRATPTASGSR